MSSEVISALIGALGVMVGTILGYWLQREAKKIAVGIRSGQSAEITLMKKLLAKSK